MLKISAFYLDKQKNFIPEKTLGVPSLQDIFFFNQQMAPWHPNFPNPWLWPASPNLMVAAVTYLPYKSIKAYCFPSITRFHFKSFWYCSMLNNVGNVDLINNYRILQPSFWFHLKKWKNSPTLISSELALVWRSKFALNNSDWCLKHLDSGRLEASVGMMQADPKCT